MTELQSIAMDHGFDGKRGHHGGEATAKLAEELAACQAGCWLCGEPFTEGDPVTVDRLATGQELGVCSLPEARCQNRADCRCGYRRGAVAGAHSACHSPGGIRQELTAAELATLARRFAPTAAEMAEARRKMRAQSGRDRAAEAQHDRRLRQARERAR